MIIERLVYKAYITTLFSISKTQEMYKINCIFPYLAAFGRWWNNQICRKLRPNAKTQISTPKAWKDSVKAKEGRGKILRLLKEPPRVVHFFSATIAPG
jgi:hypothetical protein